MPDAVQTLINELKEYVSSAKAQPVKVTIATMVAAFEEIEGAIVPFTTNVSAHDVYAGPVSGSPALPTFRALVSGDLPIATTSLVGAVKPDGTSILIDVSGVISAAGGGPFLPLAGGTMTGTIVGADGGSWGSAGMDNITKLGLGMVPSNILDITENQNAGSEIAILNNNGGTGAFAGITISNGTNACSLIQFGTANANGNFAQISGTTEFQIAMNARPITFHTNFSGIENGRWATDGSFLVNTTTNGGWAGNAKFEAVAGQGGTGVSGYFNGTNGNASTFRTDQTSGALAEFFFSTGQVGSITTNGTTTTYGTTSDRNLKHDFGAADVGDLFDRPSMQVHHLAWNNNFEAGEFVGLIAQDVYADLPHLVRPGDGTRPWQIDHPGMVPYLIAELQTHRAALKRLNAFAA